MFAFYDDFGIDTVLNKGQLKQSPEGFASLTAPLYGCPVYNNGACQGGIPGTDVGFQRNIRPISGTNFVPRMSTGCLLYTSQGIRPIPKNPGFSFFRNWYSGCACGPFTSILAKMGKVTPYSLPQNALISSALPGSCPPNWLHGNPSTSSPRPR